jgi:hypothetical protein
MKPIDQSGREVYFIIFFIIISGVRVIVSLLVLRPLGPRHSSGG